KAHRLSAAIPAIGGFDDFYVNHFNPFIPWQERNVEAIAYRVKPKPPTTVPKPPPPPPPVTVVTPPPRHLVLPKLKPAPPNAPVCVGLISQENEQPTLMVRMPSDLAA